ncbi:RAC-gamma serine/threonine-protein kinase [Irineochytrium annulatum]|nr:RAC-gamma serine/threonine-protein kinase [Irineochytrium annulatum]
MADFERFPTDFTEDLNCDWQSKPSQQGTFAVAARYTGTNLRDPRHPRRFRGSAIVMSSSTPPKRSSNALGTPVTAEDPRRQPVMTRRTSLQPVIPEVEPITITPDVAAPVGKTWAFQDDDEAFERYQRRTSISPTAGLCPAPSTQPNVTNNTSNVSLKPASPAAGSPPTTPNANTKQRGVTSSRSAMKLAEILGTAPISNNAGVQPRVVVPQPPQRVNSSSSSDSSTSYVSVVGDASAAVSSPTSSPVSLEPTSAVGKPMGFIDDDQYWDEVQRRKSSTTNLEANEAAAAAAAAASSSIDPNKPRNIFAIATIKKPASPRDAKDATSAPRPGGHRKSIITTSLAGTSSSRAARPSSAGTSANALPSPSGSDAGSPGAAAFDVRRLAELQSRCAAGHPITAEADLQALAQMLRYLSGLQKAMRRRANNGVGGEEVDLIMGAMTGRRSSAPAGVRAQKMDPGLMPQQVSCGGQESLFPGGCGGLGDVAAAAAAAAVARLSSVSGAPKAGRSSLMILEPDARIGKVDATSSFTINPRQDAEKEAGTDAAAEAQPVGVELAGASSSSLSKDAIEAIRVMSTSTSPRSHSGIFSVGTTAAGSSMADLVLPKFNVLVEQDGRAVSVPVTIPSAEDLFRSAPASTASRESVGASSTLPSKNGSLPVFFYDENGGCNFFTMAPNVTVNEVLVQALVQLGVTEPAEVFEVVQLRQVDGKNTEFSIFPNTPLDFLPPSHQTSSFSSSLFSARSNVQQDESISGSSSGPVSLKLKRRPTTKWNVTVGVDFKANRTIAVDAFTTMADLKKIVMILEAIEEEEREDWTLIREVDAVTGSTVTPPASSLLDPFESNRLMVRHVSTRNTNQEKLSALLGITNVKELKQVVTKERRGTIDVTSSSTPPRRAAAPDAAPPTPAAIAAMFKDPLPLLPKPKNGLLGSNLSLGLPKSKSMGSLATICLGANGAAAVEGGASGTGEDDDAVRKKEEEADMRNRSRSKGFTRSISASTLSLGSVGTRSMKAAKKEEETSDDEDDFPHEGVTVQRKSKIAGFFGVQDKHDDMKQINDMMGRKRSMDRRPSALQAPTFISRFYYANMTYTSLNLPLTATTTEAITLLLEKLRVDPSERDQYAIYEYFKTGYEAEVSSAPRLYDIMSRWENNEIFLFKKRPTVRQNRLRGSRSSTRSGITAPDALAAGEGDSDDLAIAAFKRKRNAGKLTKLAGFFGVDPLTGGGAAGPSGGISRAAPGTERKMSMFGNRRKNSRKGDGTAMDELLKLLNMVDLSGKMSKVKPEKDAVIEKMEGWLSMKKGGVQVPTWCYIDDDTMYIQPSTSSDVAPVSDSSISVEVALSGCRVELLMTGFVLTTRHGMRFTFVSEDGPQNMKWVEAINRMAAGRRDEDENGDEFDTQSIMIGMDESEQEKEGTDGAARSPGRRLSMNDFEVHKVLGRGKYGTVMLCSQKSTAKVYAVKVIEKTADSASALLESQILRTITHPFIVSLHAAFQTPSRLFLIMGYVNGGELFFHVANFGRFDERRGAFYAAEIYLAVRCLHDHGIVYRDLKLENILLDRTGHIRITDFGLARRIECPDTDDAEIVGTLEYLAPEVLEGLGTSYASDWWALGIVCYEMISACHPFHADERQDIMENILQQAPGYPAHMSKNAKSFLSALIEKDPRKRLGAGAAGAVEIESHPFMAGIDFAKLIALEVTPPFVPEVSDDFDVRFFDEVFTDEPVENGIDDGEDFETVEEKLEATV